MAPGVRFKILGPVEVERDGEALSVGGPKLRGLLAYLLLHTGDTLTSDVLIDVLWAEHPPATARATLQVFVSKLRKFLGSVGPSCTIETRGAGYALLVDFDRVDVLQFERLVEDGRQALAANDYPRALDALRRATSLWRGDPLSGCDLEGLESSELTRLYDRHHVAEVGALEAELALGGPEAALGELERLRGEDPLDERVVQLTALAQYRVGRQADALDTLARLRRTLSEQLGIEPGGAILDIERRILGRDPALDIVLELPDASAAHRGRKIVSAVVVRLALPAGPQDPEVRRATTSAVLDLVGEALEQTGGVVRESSAGRVVAVFGSPHVHEDDAARSTIAASDAIAFLSSTHTRPTGAGVEARIGVARGEVLVDAAGGREDLLSLEPLEFADRLASSAAVGEVLMDEATVHAAGPSLVTIPSPIVLVGDARLDTTAYRLERPPKVGERSRASAPFVGREDELEILRRTFARVAREGAAALVTVIGTPGIGKSTLVEEFTKRLPGARAFVAGCLPYGADITVRPLAEIMKRAAGISDEDASDVARRKLGEALGTDPDATFIAQQVASVLGLTEEAPVPDEVSWAIRRFLGVLARDAPLVLVVDDLQWADTGLLDLIEDVVTWTRDDPLLIVGIARPELLEERPSWGQGPQTAMLTVGPLGVTESESLLDALLGEGEVSIGAKQRIAFAAEGHPLFLAELASLLLEERAGMHPEPEYESSAGSMPRTVRALVEERLDRLPFAERRTLELGAVVGHEFDLEELAAVGGASVGDVGISVSALVRRDLLFPAGGSTRTGPRYRFRHRLIRDAVYASVPKETRAHSHASSAIALEQRSGARITEIEEIVGYHYEAAHRYRAELGLTDDLDPPARRRAAVRLASAGRRAIARGDTPAAASFLARAESLLEDADPEFPEIAWLAAAALLDAGSFLEAVEAAERGLAAAERSEDERLAWRLRLERTDALSYVTAEGHGARETEQVASEALEALERLGDIAGMARAHRLFGDTLSERGHQEEAMAHFLTGQRLAREVGDEREATERAGLGLVLGSVPADRAITLIREGLEWTERPNPDTLAALGYLLAMVGRPDEAEATLAEGYERAKEIGGDWRAASVSMYYAVARLIAGDPVGAEAVIRRGVEALERMGERALLSSAAPLLAEALYKQGRLEEAMRACVLSAEVSDDDDIAAQTARRGVQAKVLAAQGDLEEAERLAREGVAQVEGSDFLQISGDAYADLGRVLASAGKVSEARGAFTHALDLYERKGNVVSAASLGNELEPPSARVAGHRR
jgi:predicted ATPase/DNA-binding SARP family transcriptional activator